MLPCHAAQTPATTVLQQLATVPEVAPATLSQRAAALGSLALLPASTEAFWAVEKPGQSAADILAMPMMQALCGAGCDVSSLMGVRDVAIGLGSGTADMMQRFNSVQAQVRAMQIEGMVGNMIGTTSPGASRQQDEMFRKLADVFNQGGLSVTMVASLDAPTMAACRKNLSEAWAECLDQGKEKGRAEGLEAYKGQFAGLEFSGFKADMGAVLGGIANPALSGAFAGKIVYVLWAVSGDHLIVTVTQDPAKQIRLAKTPAESVIAGDKASFVDGRLTSDLRSVAFASAPVIAALYDSYKQDYRGMEKGVASILTQQVGILGEKQVKGLQSATSSLVGRMIQAVNSYGKGDATFVAWKQNGLRMEVTCASTSLISMEPVRFASLANQPGNVFYSEGAVTAEAASLYRGIWGDLGSIAWYGLEAAANVEKAKSPDRPGGQLQMSAMLMQMISPALNEFWASWQRTGSGLGQHWAVVGDLVAPAFPANDSRAANYPPSPRVAAYFPVTNRAEVVAGWQGMVNAADKIAGACGLQPGSIVSMMKGAATDRGNGVTDYGLNLYGTTLLSSLSDQALVLGNSPDLNAEMMHALKQPASALSGQAACLRFGPLAGMLGKLAAGGVSIGSCDAQSLGQIAALIEQSIDGVFSLSTEQGGRMRSQIYIKTK